ncbi:ferrochelatase [Propionibacterium freudenreichii]|uniref:ferrochelatase n=1 Tax=Propionibacterium freudenreichii TaxID=1744 RepID=UPI0005A5CEE8|nr:ferrochelatase [Propionibacterium freudenreichii]MDK9331245.1 ferrochelatase [Propionibacterium freudenreichii]MDK9662647.1 ferrochelatase [Propionibacterium freudenreichii]CEI50575.1 Ferrochelatase (Protoheme ferro-lyase)(Heme synthetase) [Propionibacterium freudenreichii]SBT28575.1 Ferrochelatase [Propionibacterium freudenreichii]
MTSFDALLVAGFGGPESMAEVPDFLQRVSGGHIPPDRLAEVEHHYARFGGVSPVNAQHRALAAALGEALVARGIDVPIANANRHSMPYMDQALADLQSRGIRRVLTLVPTPYASYSGCRAYREELLAGTRLDDEGRPALQVVKLDPYADLPALVTAQVQLLRAALADHPDAHLVFTTHSIPTAMAETSGPHGNAYIPQHLALIDAVMAELAAGGLRPSWELAYQSRSGSPRTPWLEPDINDVITRLAGEGARDVICSPIGFLTDHMEVVWDLDTEAAATAAEHSMAFTRVATVGTLPVFIEGLADLVVAALATEPGTGPDAPAARHWCTPDCCPNARVAGRPTIPGFAAGPR